MAIRTFAVTASCSIICIVSFNFTVDPARRWHNQALDLVEDLRPGYFLHTPENFDERKIRVKFLQATEPFDLAVFGSSLAVQMDTALFDPSLKILNLAMSGSVVEDYVALWQQIKELGKIPRYVLFYLEVQKFSGFHEVRWQTNAQSYFRFLREVQSDDEEWSGLRSESAKIWISKTYSEVTDLLTMGLLKSALQEEFTRWRDNPPNDWGIEKRASWNTKWTGYRFDGSSIYPKDTLRPMTPEELANVNTRIQTTANWIVRPATVALFEALLKDMTSKGVTPVIIVPPFLPAALDILKNRPRFGETVTKFWQVIHALQARYPGILYCDAEDTVSGTFRDEDFFDPYHMLRPGIVKAFHYCSKNFPGLTPLVRDFSGSSNESVWSAEGPY